MDQFVESDTVVSLCAHELLGVGQVNFVSCWQVAGLFSTPYDARLAVLDNLLGHILALVSRRRDMLRVEPIDLIGIENRSHLQDKGPCRAREAGAGWTLAKPFSREQLIETVQEMVE